MITRKIKIAFMAMLAALGMMFAVAAPANAYTIGAPGSAAEVTSAPSYSMCGTAYSDGPWVDNYPLPAGARAVEGAVIEATLYGSSDNVVSTVMVTTAADGTYCITGNFGWAAIITGGGKVVVNSVDGGQMDASGASTRTIDVNLFNAKRVGGLLGTSALPFNLKFV